MYDNFDKNVFFKHIVGSIDKLIEKLEKLKTGM
jgi:hypothetical protein